jgi:hypothetical protein
MKLLGDDRVEEVVVVDHERFDHDDVLILYLANSVKRSRSVKLTNYQSIFMTIGK